MNVPDEFQVMVYDLSFSDSLSKIIKVKFEYFFLFYQLDFTKCESYGFIVQLSILKLFHATLR